MRVRFSLPSSVRSFALYGSLWTLLGMIQLGTIASLTSPLSYTPLVFMVGIGLVERGLVQAGVLWVVFFGLLVDSLHVGDAPLDSISYGAAALCAYLLVVRVFSHRSRFATVAIAYSALGTLSLFQVFFSFSYWIISPERIIWIDVWELVWKRAVMLALLLLVFLLFVRPLFHLFAKRFTIERR